MEFGIFHEFLTTQTGSQTEAFVQSFAQIEAAESWARCRVAGRDPHEPDAIAAVGAR
jgi:hypothetical protein